MFVSLVFLSLKNIGEINVFYCSFAAGVGVLVNDNEVETEGFVCGAL
jgi:hypothetical protein